MPSKIDYAKTPIQFYQFVCKNDGVSNTYVGATVSWRARKALHKCCCNDINSPKYNLKVYQIIRANGGFSNWDMIEIHKQICVDKRDSERVEQSLMSKLKCDMNTNRAFRTAEQLEEYQSQYRLNNRTDLYAKQNAKHTCCCGGRYTLTNKLQHLETTKHLTYIPLDICPEINI